MVPEEFLAYLLVSYLGVIAWVLVKSIRAMRRDPDTPDSFSARLFFVGILRTILSLLILPWAVVYFSDLVPFILKFLLTLPEGMEVPAEINGFSAFILGFVVDYLIDKLRARLNK